MGASRSYCDVGVTVILEQSIQSPTLKGWGTRQAGGVEAVVSNGQKRKGLRGYWQPRFWEHTIRDENDFGRHLDYIHYNPVKHELARCAHAWPFSSFHRWVERGVYDAEWCCACSRGPQRRPDFSDIERSIGE